MGLSTDIFRMFGLLLNVAIMFDVHLFHIVNLVFIRPATNVTNKHCIILYNCPCIRVRFYPLHSVFIISSTWNVHNLSLTTFDKSAGKSSVKLNSKDRSFAARFVQNLSLHRDLRSLVIPMFMPVIMIQPSINKVYILIFCVLHEKLKKNMHFVDI